MIDLRGIPTRACPECGTNIFKVMLWLDKDDNTIAGYLLDAECAVCSSLVTLATPEDAVV